MRRVAVVGFAFVLLLAHCGAVQHETAPPMARPAPPPSPSATALLPPRPAPGPSSREAPPSKPLPTAALVPPEVLRGDRPPTFDEAFRVCARWVESDRVQGERCDGWHPPNQTGSMAWAHHCAYEYSAPGMKKSMQTLVDRIDTQLDPARCTFGHRLELEGTLPLGARCAMPDQCASGRCANRDGCGRCAPARRPGERCRSDFDCASYSCNAGRCEAPARRSHESCARDDECESKECADGHCTVSLIDRAPTIGDACLDDGDCGLLRCLEGTCQLAAAIGEPCATRHDCRRWLVCESATGTCRAPKVARAGERCGGRGEAEACDFSFGCDVAIEGVCPEVVEMGAACDASVPRPGGHVTRVCGHGAHCIGGRCAAFDPGVCTLVKATNGTAVQRMHGNAAVTASSGRAL